jgi:ubiquinone/menaquinone biosynthesis C-methylase UbiE
MNETPNTSVAELFDAMVATYEIWAEPLSDRLAQVAVKKTSVRAGDCVLDIGAGTGALSLQAAALGARLTAIDLSSAMVDRLTQRLDPYPECKALVMDSQALTFEDSTFDALFHSIDHLVSEMERGVGRSGASRATGRMARDRPLGKPGRR